MNRPADPNRWREVKELFNGAIAREPGERASFLASRCNGDDALREEAERLVAAHEKAGEFIETPAFADTPHFGAADPEALVGGRLGHYRVESVLGVGGMGIVYLAFDERLERKVALKLLPPAVVADETQLKRLKREARTASALNHPNIVTIHEIGEADGTHYLTAEFIEGITLRERLAQERIAPNEALNIAAQVASALSVAHAAGIVHRDIKPENIMLRPDGYVKVLDFGIAQFTPRRGSQDDAHTHLLTQHGVILGTTRYMSPEQARGLPVDHRTDIWSLGAVLYEMLAGRQPFEGATPTDVLIAIVERELSPLLNCAPEIPVQLERVVSKALAKEPANRYQTADEMLADLRRAEQSQQRRTFTSRAYAFVARRSRTTKAAALAGVLVLLAFVAVVELRRASTPAPPAIDSIAVLPLVNLSGDPTQDYFADGTTDALIADLARVAALRVISRTSSMHYKGSKKSLAEIARELRVDAVVEGTVHRSGGRVRIRAQLIHAPTDRHLWAETYERNVEDVLSLQSEIAQAIAREVYAKVTPAEQARLAANRAVPAKALENYLQGRYLFWNRRSEENLHKAIESFERALEEAPDYALAYVGLADCFNQLGTVQFSVVSPLEGRRRAEEASLKALSLDPTLGEAHTALGLVKLFNWEWETAERELKRAIELSPNSASTYNSYSSLLMCRGRTDQALAASNRARELDPLSLAFAIHRGFLLGNARRYDEAIQQLESVVALDPNHAQAQSVLGRVYTSAGLFDKAILALEKAVALSERAPAVVGSLGMAYAHVGRTDEAVALLNELLAAHQTRYVTPAAIAYLYIGLGDTDRAFAWLEKAYEERSYLLAYIRTVPILDPLRSDPRFDDLVRRIGLPP